MKYLSLFAFCILSITALHAQKINLKSGDEFAIRMNNTESLVSNSMLISTEDFTFQFKMLGSTVNGYKLECQLLKAKLWKKDKLYRLNTDSLRLTELNYSGLLTQLTLLQRPFTLIISPQGKFVKTEGIEQLIKKVTKLWSLKEDIEQYLQGNIDVFLMSALKPMFFEVPKEKLGYQSAWTNEETKTTYKVTAIRGSLLDIVPVTTQKNWSAKFLLNDVNGLLEDMSSTYSQINVPDAKTYGRTQTIIYGKSTAPAIDTAWLNMAIPLSYWSDVFKNKANEIDLAKVFSYFNLNDKAYEGDPFYTTAKLRFVQGLKGPNSFKNYRALLAKTPNKLLAEERSHLFNKLQWAADINADSAYNVIAYMCKYPNFAEWLQESFAQGFLRVNNLVAMELLEKLKADKKLGIQPLITPMYLWVKAKQQPNNLTLLSKTYDQFMKMNDVNMHKGNGARYALLTYKLLINANKQNEANKLLDKTNQTLERFNADTLNEHRLADRNILAYTYYLKYHLALKTDSISAMQYLSKASQYSPQDKRDQAYTSFYDRVFLNSKESYSDEFINKLLAGGNIDTALKIFADNINANPARLKDMEKLYQKHFADKSFKEFFINNVMRNWKDAPAFELTDIDGKKHALADYKNKWLILDFWGTWCSPCRDEMPKVNAFNQELIEGKHNGIKLLSVACYDNLPSVKKYITNNNFGITTAVSDNLIERNYKVSGFPSKILIAPNGKMIDVVFNSDWVAIIKKLNELYAAN